jgi:hypothetical protein
MATKNALLSLSSGVNEKYIFQVIKVTKISDKIVRYIHFNQDLHYLMAMLILVLIHKFPNYRK